jgi:YfiH family protein
MTVEWLAADWPAPANVAAGTTLRKGGVSRGACASLNLAAHVGDDPEAVRENRRRFVATCGLPSEPLWLEQVHGTRVATADDFASAPADALVTNRPGVVCAVLTADCLPVVLAAADGSEVGIAHAGWRGLAAGILEATVERFAAPAEGLLAWLGPAISQPAFEVGGEVRDAFLEDDPGAGSCFGRDARGRWQADLYALARRRLERLGIASVHGGGRCTFREPDAFFSYRRDGQCGRMATFVYRRSGVDRGRPGGPAGLKSPARDA